MKKFVFAAISFLAAWSGNSEAASSDRYAGRRALLVCQSTGAGTAYDVIVDHGGRRPAAYVYEDGSLIRSRYVTPSLSSDGVRLNYSSADSVLNGGLSLRIRIADPLGTDTEGYGHLTIKGRDGRMKNVLVDCAGHELGLDGWRE